MNQNSQQTNRNGRRLTSKQRQRILQERKMRRFRHRLYACLALLGALIVVLIATLIVTRNRPAPARPALSLATPVPTEAPTPVSTVAAEVTATPEVEAAVQSTRLESVTADASAVPVQETAVSIQETAVSAKETIPPTTDERIEIAAPSYDPSAPFSYEDAYVAAVHGVDTGAPVTPDYSGIDSSKRDRWPEADEGFMPMLSKANTKEKIIAVTVDDCFQANNLKDIVQCALQNSAKLTIFPIGENLERSEIAAVVKTAWEYGMEIENHTYSHKGTYHYDDDAMTDDIWKQSYLLNKALGVNYRQHFFRPKGGDERFDQRSHAYVCQLGFAAIALWTQSGSVDSMDSLLKNLAPGRIYLFHTTDKDRKKLLQFIPEAVKRGYKLVTLNDMFGLPANETADLSTAPTEKPALASFRVKPMTLKMTSYARAAAVVQKRLIELGWMLGEPTGVYGKTTHACMELFQSAAGLPVDGTAGAQTQAALFADSAPVGSASTIRTLAAQMDSDVQSAIEEMLASAG